MKKPYDKKADYEVEIPSVEMTADNNKNLEEALEERKVRIYSRHNLGRNLVWEFLMLKQTASYS